MLTTEIGISDISPVEVYYEPPNLDQIADEIDRISEYLASDPVYQECRMFLSYSKSVETRRYRKPMPRDRKEPAIVISYNGVPFTYRDGGGKLDVIAQHFYDNDPDGERKLLAKLHDNHKMAKKRSELRKQLKSL